MYLVKLKTVDGILVAENDALAHARLHVPHANSVVIAARHNVRVIKLEAQHTLRVARELADFRQPFAPLRHLKPKEYKR